MFLFVQFLGYALGLLPTIVTGIQSVAGDVTAGATKAQMAKDALSAALATAATVLVPGGSNATMAKVTGVAATGVIDATSAIAAVLSHIHNTNAITAAVNVTKSTGAYQAATALATAAAAAAAAAPAAAAPAVELSKAA